MGPSSLLFDAHCQMPESDQTDEALQGAKAPSLSLTSHCGTTEVVPFRTPVVPFRTPVVPFRTSVPPFRTSVVPFRTPVVPFRTPVVPFRTSVVPFRTPVVPFRTSTPQLEFFRIMLAFQS